MGGFGSGYFSWRRLPRNLVEQAFVLDLAVLCGIRGANGVASGQLKLVARATGEALHLGYVAVFTDPANPHLHLIFRASGKQQEQVISLDATTPRYGGIRYWFLCPVTGERTRCLYLTRDADAFASRAVHGLSYRSQSESAFWRSVRQAQKIRTQLGGDPSIYSAFPTRPRGMHRRRYKRLSEEAAVKEGVFWTRKTRPGR
jgi:hypothetical protein